jgi:hypothetical protein
MSGNTAEFKLSITRALTDQLESSLDLLTEAPFSAEAILDVAPVPGVYQLFYRGEVVYVGKTAKNLSGRLRQHFDKVAGRVNLRIEDMGFTCLYVDEDLDSVAPEKHLIKRYRDRGRAEWNNNGFGNKDPGSRRDESTVKSNHFDHQFPINLDWPCEFLPSIGLTVDVCLRDLKRRLPYTFRYAKGSVAAYPEFATELALPPGPIVAKDVFAALAAALPDGWQITALPGYVVMYKEQRTYATAKAVWASGDSARTSGEEGLSVA